jgi:hypothetical protein
VCTRLACSSMPADNMDDSWFFLKKIMPNVHSHRHTWCDCEHFNKTTQNNQPNTQTLKTREGERYK